MCLPHEAGLEEAADPYEFLDENFSIPGILDNLDKLSPKELKCACCLFGTALQQARKKKKESGIGDEFLRV